MFRIWFRCIFTLLASCMRIRIILNYRSVHPRTNAYEICGSLLFYQRFKETLKKIKYRILSILIIFYLFDNIFFQLPQKCLGWIRSFGRIRIPNSGLRNVDPNPKDTFTFTWLRRFGFDLASTFSFTRLFVTHTGTVSVGTLR
jgi:hypothetical protein